MATTEAPPDLCERGLALWQGYVAERPALAPGERLLLHEACRTADRLDRLAALIAGDEGEWMVVEVPDRDGPLVLIVNGAIAEARQLLNVLRLTLASLEALRSLNGSHPGEPDKPEGEADPVANLSARIAARRRADATG